MRSTISSPSAGILYPKSYLSGLAGLDAVTPHAADLTGTGAVGHSIGVQGIGGGGGAPASGTVPIAGTQGSAFHPREFVVGGRNTRLPVPAAKAHLAGAKRSILRTQYQAASRGFEPEITSDLLFGHSRGMSFWFGRDAQGERAPAISSKPLTPNSKGVFTFSAKDPFDIAAASEDNIGLGSFYNKRLMYETSGLGELSGGFFSHPFGKAFTLKRVFTRPFSSPKSFAMQTVHATEVALPAAVAGFAAGGPIGFAAGAAYGYGKGYYGEIEGAPVSRSMYQALLPSLAIGGVAGYLAGTGIASYAPGSGYFGAGKAGTAFVGPVPPGPYLGSGAYAAPSPAGAMSVNFETAATTPYIPSTATLINSPAPALAQISASGAQTVGPSLLARAAGGVFSGMKSVGEVALEIATLKFLNPSGAGGVQAQPQTFGGQILPSMSMSGQGQGGQPIEVSAGGSGENPAPLQAGMSGLEIAIVGGVAVTIFAQLFHRRKIKNRKHGNL